MSFYPESQIKQKFFGEIIRSAEVRAALPLTLMLVNLAFFVIAPMVKRVWALRSRLGLRLRLPRSRFNVIFENSPFKKFCFALILFPALTLTSNPNPNQNSLTDPRLLYCLFTFFRCVSVIKE